MIHAPAFTVIILMVDCFVCLIRCSSYHQSWQSHRSKNQYEMMAYAIMLIQEEDAKNESK